MAAGEVAEEPLKKGSILTVTVEEALPSVITVCYKHGTKTYRGALMDTGFIVGPHGIDVNREQIVAANQPLRPPEVLVVDPNHEPGSKPEISCLPLRHTFQLDPNAVDLKLLPPPPRRDISKPLRDKKNVRAMRLRPRKVLCSNCKQGIHDNKVKNVMTRSSSKSEASAPDSSNNTQNINSGKRKPDPEPDPGSNRKTRKIEKTDLASKTVPVLKISFSTSKDGGTVVKIPMQPPGDQHKGQENADPCVNESPPTAMTHQQYRKMRKALKKAKLKEKLQKTGSVDVEGDLSEGSHHRKNKHGKHKLKRKHKYRDIDARNGPQDEDNCENKQEFEGLEQNGQKLDAEYEFDSPEKYSISNAGEFTTIKKSIVRLTKLNIKEKAQNVNMLETMAKTGEEGQEGEEEDVVSTDQPLEEQEDIQGNIEVEERETYINVDEDNISPVSSPGSSNNPQETSGTMYQVQVSDISDPEDEDVSGGSSSLQPPQEEQQQQQQQEESSFPPPSTTTNTSYSALSPLLMRIQTKNVAKCELSDGRIMTCGDIVWGKVHGFPWWPGRIISLTQSQKDVGIIVANMANVSWFGSSTMSYMDCLDLYPYLEYYKLRYSKKKKGPYKVAVKQATKAAKLLLSGNALLDASDLLDIDSESFDGYDSLQDMDDLHSLHSLDKENMDSLDSQGLLDYEDIKQLQEENKVTTPTQTPSNGKVETLDEELEHLNNIHPDAMDTFSRQFTEDINNIEMLEA